MYLGAFGTQPYYWVASKKCFKNSIFASFDSEEQRNSNDSQSKCFI